MRDVYPLVITRIEHMITLLQNNATAEAVARLPLSLCFNAVRLETITRETRLFMLHVSFFMVKNLYDAKKSGPKGKNYNIHIAVVDTVFEHFLLLFFDRKLRVTRPAPREHGPIGKLFRLRENGRPWH
jgi:hypothetical protein